MALTRTRWLVVALVVLGVALAGVAGAVTVANEDVPDDERVGETITVQVGMEDLYQNPVDEQWYVTGETELRNATWTVVFSGPTGETIREVDVDGRFLNRSAVDRPDDLLVDSTRQTSADSVSVRVTGDVPRVEAYTYPELGTNGSAESFLGLSLVRDSGTGAPGEVIESWSVVHYTDQSRAARAALDNASATIGAARDAGLDVSGAVDDFTSARSSYQNDNFENAIDLAEDATQSAQAALDAQGGAEGDGDDGLPVVLIAVAVLAVAALVGVAAYYARQDDGPDTKLR
jgi:hypothetical protein